MDRTKAGRSVVAAVVAALAGGLAVMVLRPAVASPITAEKAGVASCTTDATGFCTVDHALGTAPTGVLVTPRSPASGQAINSHMTADRFTATTFRVRAWRPSGGYLADTPVTFTWLAFSTPEPSPEPTGTSAL